MLRNANPLRSIVPRGRLGAAAVEKVVIATLVIGVLGPVAWVVGTSEMKHLSRFSCSLEQNLSKDTDLSRNRSASGRSSSEQPKFVSTASASTEEVEETIVANNSINRILWISLLSASLVTVGLLWVSYSQKRKVSSDSKEQSDDLKQSLRSLKTQLETEMRPGCVFTKRQQTMKTLLQQFDKINCQELQIRHVLTHKVKTILPTTAADEVRNLFTKRHYRHVLVCDSEKHLLGIITARDLQRKSGGTAAELMTTNLVTVSPDHFVSPVITMMMDKRISCLPVIEDSRFIGIVTTTDLMIALQCTLKILTAINEGFHGASPKIEDRETASFA